MSKRHGAVGVMQYRDEGYLPDALLNYLVRLGWSHGDKEIFSREELLRYFRIEDVNRAASTFNPEKLLWVNHEHIKSIPIDELMEASAWHFERAGISLDSIDNADAVIELIRERARTLQELVDQSAFFFRDTEGYDPSAVKKHIRPASAGLLQQVLDGLTTLEDWQADAVHGVVQSVVESNEVGFAKVAQPIRIAVTGSTQSPSIDQTLALLGRERSLHRLTSAVEAFQMPDTE